LEKLTLTLILLYLVCGAVAGLWAGLLGLGGGLVVVPLLNYIFQQSAAVPDTLCMRLAVGTSLASILFTAASSSRAHARRGSVLWPWVPPLAPALALGTALGSKLSVALPVFGLKAFFAFFLVAVAVQTLADYYPAYRGSKPGLAVMAGAGLVIGGVSSLVGLGGGTMSVPFLRWSGVDMRRAVGTSAALGWAIALAGSLGYVVNGWGAAGLPAYSLGYVSLPATLGVAATSIFFAPLGARLSHALPVNVLKKIFAGFLVLMAARLTWELLA
jgi:uncharacterized membrane protein YfcA